jgi:hypothetical protein
MSMLRVLVFIPPLALIAGCSPTVRQPPDTVRFDAAGTQAQVVCREPRPQVCTQDYRPVCATLRGGGFKTYSNGCNACSDPAVASYREGACE